MLVLKEVDNDRPQEQQMGWECPRCRVSVSPMSDVCPKCEQKKLREQISQDKELLLG